MPARPAGDGELSEISVPDPTEPAAEAVLEFLLAPGAAARLMRAPALAAARQGRWRQAKLHVVWHDGPAGELARRGLVVASEGGRWRLERLVPNGEADWPPAGPPPVLAEAPDLAGLGDGLPERLVPVAAFTGRQRRLALAGPTRLTLIEGAVRGLTTEAPACRLRLEGEACSIGALARDVAAQVGLSLPAAGMAADAAALAAGGVTAPRHLGPPAVPPDASVEQALEAVLIHLADVVLHWARLVPGATGPEPVHQMRVGLRRLRAALSVFRPVAQGEAMLRIAGQVRDLSRLLGAARDWDVFLSGPGDAVPRAVSGEPGLLRLRAGAERKRRAAYASLGSFLAGAEWRALGFELALLPTLRPWRADADALEGLRAPVRDFAARALERRHRQLVAPGAKLGGMSDEALHELRKQAKRMRYAAELFATLYAGRGPKRYLRRLASVQAAFGEVNDAATAAALLRELPSGFAAGLVRGYVAAGAERQGGEARRAWKKFAHAEPFWQ